MIVYCSGCRDTVDAEKVKVLDVREGVQGQDVVKFVCHVCGTECESEVRGR